MKVQKEKIVKKLNKHRLIVTFFVIAIPCVALVIMTCNKKYFTSSMTGIEFAYYMSQIFLSIFAITGTVIAVWQYYLSSKSDIRQTQLIQVQKAVDLSGYYKDNILHKSLPIVYVYDRTGISSIINKIDQGKINKFDNTELKSLLRPEDIKKLKKIQSSAKFVRAIREANTIYNLNGNLNYKLNEKKRKNKKTGIVSPDFVAVSFFSGIFSDVLNNLEFFAMHFLHNTADDSVVYRSLHQSYLRLMRLFYYQIASKNECPESKFYTNAIDLYKKWNQQNQEDIARIQKGIEELAKGTIVDPK